MKNDVISRAILLLFVSYVPVTTGSCRSFMHDIVNCYEMYKVYPLTPPDSIVALCDQYFPICNAKVAFLNCYLNALYTCQDYRTHNPLIFDEVSIRTILLGCCDNRDVINYGKDCFASSYGNLNVVISFVCYDHDDIVENGYVASTTSNWTQFCSDLDDKYECIQGIIRPMNCSTEYYESVTHLYYSVFPPPCQNQSDVFHWFYRYGLKSKESNQSNAPTITTWLFLISNVILQL